MFSKMYNVKKNLILDGKCDSTEYIRCVRKTDMKKNFVCVQFVLNFLVFGEI